MHIHIDLITGLPFEDMKSFEKSFNIGFSLNSNMLQIGFLKLLHGADMRENTSKYPCEFSKKPPYEIISNEWLCAEEIQKLHLFEDTFERLYNSGRFMYTCEYLIENSGDDAFKFFFDFSENHKYKQFDKISLDEFSHIVYDYFCKKAYVDSKVLRDKMVCDRLRSVRGGYIPDFLRIKDEKLKEVKSIIRNKYPLKEGTKRAVAILYSEKCAVFADYENIHKSGFGEHFKVNKISFVDALEEK